MTRLWAAIVMLFLAGCTTRNVGENYTLEGKTNEGLVVVSVSYEGLGDNDNPSCRYREVDSEKGRKGTLLGSLVWNSPADWREPRGRLAYFVLPPGHYEFYLCGFARIVATWAPYYTVGPNGIVAIDPVLSSYTTTSSYDSEQFSVQFDVVAGQAIYVGNLHLVWSEREESGVVHWRDESPRDLALLHGRLSRIVPEQITRLSLP